MRFTWRRRRLIYWLKKEAKNKVEDFEEIKACSEQQLADLEKQSAEKKGKKAKKMAAQENGCCS